MTGKRFNSDRQLGGIVSGCVASVALGSMPVAISHGAYTLTAWLGLLVVFAVTVFITHVYSGRMLPKFVHMAGPFLLSTAFAFGSEAIVVPYYAYLPSFLLFTLLYYRKRIVFISAVVHLSAMALAYKFAAGGTIDFVELPFMTMIPMIVQFISGAHIDSKQNIKYLKQMRTLQNSLKKQTQALKTQTAATLQQREELQQAQQELHSRVIMHTQSLERLSEINAERAALAQAAGSDLRQPIRNIGSFIQLIGRRLNKLGLADDVAEYLQYVSDGTARMNAMVEDLLLYCNYTSCSTPLDTVQVSATLAAVEESLINLVERERASIIVEGDLPEIKGHKTQITQLFQNLISNGIKFRREGVDPICTVGCITKIGEHIFFVRDNGLGMPEERLEDIFGIFTRLHARGSYEGTGIGLALCRRIVLAAGGKIWATSTEGEGTTFWFTWPKAVLDDQPIALPLALAV